MRSFLLLSVLMFFVCGSFPATVSAGEPMEEVQSHVNKILDVLRDPELKEESAKDKKEEKIVAIANDMFSYHELSRLTLGKNWNKLTSEQQQEFTDLFSTLLLDIYLKKIMQYTDEKIVFPKVTMKSEEKAEVQSNIITSSKEIPVYYRAQLQEGLWKVYDVIIEGVSLIKNYRSQFKEILSKGNSEKLLEVLRKKVSKA